MLPVMMTAPEEATFKDFLRCAGRYLEFGAGGSTVRAAQLVARQVVAVESSAEWITRVRTALEAIGRADKAHLHEAAIGPTKAGGFPDGQSHRADWPRYHADIWRQHDAETFDLFLVDGRFRLACFAQVVLRCRPGAVILFHDYANRERYHPAAELAWEICRTGNLSAFVRRGDASREAAEAFLRRFEYDAD